MTKERPRNLAASVRQRLMNLARRRTRTSNLYSPAMPWNACCIAWPSPSIATCSSSRVRCSFSLERSAAPANPRSGPSGARDNSIPGSSSIFREICDLAVEEDGLVFLAAVGPGRHDQGGPGIRGAASHPGLPTGERADSDPDRHRLRRRGDAGGGRVTYPVLLDFPAPVLPAYSRESVVAEKFQAMVMLGIANSRMKDFFDLWVLARQFEFQGPLLCQAIRATFERRHTPVPADRAGSPLVRVRPRSREADAVAGVHRQGQAGNRWCGTPEIMDACMVS